MGLFGGGGGGGTDISGGVNAVRQGTQQGLGELQKYYQAGLGYLNTGGQQAQGYIAPYGVAGTTALDELYDTLGMARPETGSFALSAALRNEEMLKKLQEAPQQKKTGWLDPTSFKPNVGYSPSNRSHHSVLSNLGAGHSFDPVTGDYYSSASGAMDTGADWMDDPAADGLKVVQGNDGKYRLESLAQPDVRRPLTPEEQKQWELIQKYRAGTLAMTDPSKMQAGVLAKLQATPGYQFLMSEGLQGVDRSAAARGLVGSGAAVKGAERYAAGLAEQTFNNRVQSLASAAGMGAQSMGLQQSNAGALGSALATLGANMGANTASLYGSQASGLAGLYGAQAAANAQSQSSSNSLFGSLAGSVLGMFSDIRLKQDIIPTGEFILDVIPVYEFSYKANPDERYIGVMAQDVLKVKPEAVGMRDGFYTVHYDKLGV